MNCSPADSELHFNGAVKTTPSAMVPNKKQTASASSINIPVQVFLGHNGNVPLEDVAVDICRTFTTPKLRTNNQGGLEIPVYEDDLQPFRLTVEYPGHVFLGGDHGTANASCIGDARSYLPITFNLDDVGYIWNSCSFPTQRLYMIRVETFAISSSQYETAGASKEQAENMARIELLNDNKDIAQALALFKKGEHESVLNIAGNKINTRPTTDESVLHFTENMALIAARSAQIKKDETAMQRFYDISIKSAAYQEPMLKEYQLVLEKYETDNWEYREQFYNNYINQRVDFNTPDFQIDLWKEREELQLDKLKNPEKYQRVAPSSINNIQNINNSNSYRIRDLDKRDKKQIDALLKSENKNVNLEELSKELSKDNFEAVMNLLQKEVNE